MKAYYTVIVDRGGGEVTFELLVPLSFFYLAFGRLQNHREKVKIKYAKKTRKIHKNIIRIIKVSSKVQMKNGHRYQCFIKSPKCN